MLSIVITRVLHYICSRMLKIHCGGGYRSWDAKFPHSWISKSINSLISNSHLPSDTALIDNSSHKNFIFSYLKGQTLITTQVPFDDEDDKAVIAAALHGKQITCVRCEIRFVLLILLSKEVTINQVWSSFPISFSYTS